MGPLKVISAAVPGLPRDMLAFNSETMPSILESLDFLNVMTYDLMNRRDNVTKHHTGIQLSLEAVDAYLQAGVPSDKINLGFAFYVKWFRTEPESACSGSVGCKTTLMENPETGADLGQAGAFSYHDTVPSELAPSWERAMQNGRYDFEGGGWYYWDRQENLWWSWDTPAAMIEKFPKIVESRELGGVFAWGLGEDAPGWQHLKALNQGALTMRLREDARLRHPNVITSATTTTAMQTAKHYGPTPKMEL